MTYYFVESYLFSRYYIIIILVVITIIIEIMF